MGVFNGKQPPPGGTLAFYRGRVVRSDEFERIRALPKRVDGLVDDTPWRTATCGTPLWVSQRAALYQAQQARGGFFPLGVGSGKTLISLLVDKVLGAQRPLLLVPAHLREQTNKVILPYVRKHFNISPTLTVLAYSELSLVKNANILDEISPDLIIADECHSLKHATAARTKRLLRYFKSHPDTMFVGMSGTITRKSLRDYAHLSALALKEGSPVPLRWTEMSDWSDALDVEVRPGYRTHPGCLVDLYTGTEDLTPLEKARRGFCDRLNSTVGVVASSADVLGTSLVVQGYPVQQPEAVTDALRALYGEWVTPDGDEISEALEMARRVRELLQGFYYVWDWPEGRIDYDWLTKRAAWAKFVRGMTKSGRQLDSELQVWNWCRFQTTQPPEYLDWLAVKGRTQPPTNPIWIAKHLVGVVGQWLTDHEGPIWVAHDAVGRMLERETGLTYFGGGAKASLDILTHKQPFIASIRAHGEGKNLQQWNQSLILDTPSSGATFEQLIGRLHRPGQDADDVVFDVALVGKEVRGFVESAVRDAQYIQDTTGAPQKLLCGNLVGFGTPQG